ncbi:MAG: flagellar biosynthesis protein FlgA [Cyanobacteria bacterium RYN_339]|nr:flagellar biosynthesis protein FlgA [Cyanobacteria bacterium RYN_339]
MLKHAFQVVLGIVLVAIAALPSYAAALREQEIMDLVTNEVVKRLQVPRRDVVVEWQDMSASSLVPALPDGAVTLEVSPTAHLGGKGSVPVQVSVNGRKFRTIFPRMEIKVFQQVAVAKNRITRGSVANGGDVTMQRTAVSGMNQAPLTSIVTVLGAEATRDIPPGTILTAQMFRLPNVIKAGEMVSIVLTSGDLTIVSNGQARTAGAMGQLIKVINLQSKREFTARVVGPNRVEVKLED